MYEKVYINWPFLRIRSWTVVVPSDGLNIGLYKGKIILHWDITEMWIEYGKLSGNES